jgi:hypothetical protein
VHIDNGRTVLCPLARVEVGFAVEHLAGVAVHGGPWAPRLYSRSTREPASAAAVDFHGRDLDTSVNL